MTSHLASTQKVPYEGPERGYKILVVGEAPGAEEVGQGRPFIGRSGQLLERYLARSGVSRSQVRLGNLCKYRPRDNKFEFLLDTDELKSGLDELRSEIEISTPNIIIALGNWPTYFLTGACGSVAGKPNPGTGISLWRGSRLPALEAYGGGKVFASYHPAAVIREWGLNPIFYLDIQHAVQDSEYPELRYPEYDEYIDPSVDECQALTHEALSAPWISIDIETFPGGKYSCVGWAWKNPVGKYRAVCMTFQKAFLLEKYAKEMWQSDTPKIFQYGTYDISFMRYFYNWRVGGYYLGRGHDTFVAAASIMPDFSRGLDFLCSVYTRFPYYKTERKVWKESGDMNILWKYNIKDCVATYQIAERQMGELKELFS